MIILTREGHVAGKYTASVGVFAPLRLPIKQLPWFKDSVCMYINRRLTSRTHMASAARLVDIGAKLLYPFYRIKGRMRKSNQAMFLVLVFRLNGKVLYNERKCYIRGGRSSGRFTLKTLSGAIIASVSYKKLKLVCHQAFYLYRGGYGRFFP